MTTIEMRTECRRLHEEGKISPLAITHLSINPVKIRTFFATATRAECQMLIDSTVAGWTPPEKKEKAAPSALSAFGAMGQAIAEEIENQQTSLIANLREAADAEIDAKVDAILSRLPDITSPVRKTIALKSLAIDEKAPQNLKILAKFCSPGGALKPVKFAGEPGSSKTWAARIFGKTFFPDSTFDLSCHAGTTQREFLGSYVPYKAGFECVYGKITRAFMSAAEKPTLLIIDEINRLPLELLSVFCGALNTRDIDGIPHYVLDSGLPDGMGGTLEYAAPVHNLSIVSTCNEGPGFNVSAEDKAETQRWVHIRCEFHADEAMKIATSLVSAKWDFLTPDQVGGISSKFIAFIVSAREMALVHRRLASPPTLRAIVDTISLASSPDDIPGTLQTLTEGWHCGISRTTGQTEPEHVKSLTASLIASGFKSPEENDKK